jgi:hypothetical protein
MSPVYRDYDGARLKIALLVRQRESGTNGERSFASIQFSPAQQQFPSRTEGFSSALRDPIPERTDSEF